MSSELQTNAITRGFYINHLGSHGATVDTADKSANLQNAPKVDKRRYPQNNIRQGNAMATAFFKEKSWSIYFDVIFPKSILNLCCFRTRQHSIVGCVLPTCQPYVFWWPPLDVSTSEGGRVCPQTSKQVWTSHQWWLPDVSSGGRVSRSNGWGYPNMWPFQWPGYPTPVRCGTCLWKHYLSQTSFAGGNNSVKNKSLLSEKLDIPDFMRIHQRGNQSTTNSNVWMAFLIEKWKRPQFKV